MNDPARDDFQSPWIRDLLLIMAVALTISVILIGQGPLAGNEPHRALAADQMVRSGDWIIPRLFDQVYLAKPPLFYWILAGMEKLTGRADPFVWRLPSAIGAAITAAILYLMTARWYGRLAGLVAGISCCGLIALWGQNRTAEIDALNTTACVACVCLLLDLGFGRRRNRFAITLCATIALGAAMLLKGPASLPPIVAALVGPAIFNRALKNLKSPLPWIILAGGVAIFVGYGALASTRFRALNLPPDTSGVQEAIGNILSDRRTNLLHNLILPLQLLLYMIPVSFCLPLAFHPAIWKKPPAAADAQVNWSPRDREILRGLMGILAISLAITMLAGLVHPRYSYTWLPMICCVAGAVAAAWQRGIFPAGLAEIVRSMLPTCAALYCIAGIVLTVVAVHQEPYRAVLLCAASAGAIIACAGCLRWIHRGNLANGGWWMIVVMILASIPFSAQGVQDRRLKSMYSAAQILAAKLPANATVTTATLVMDDPALFYYANLSVESHPDVRNLPREFPTSRWVVLSHFEYPKWSAVMGNRLTDVQQIPSPDGTVFLAWYVPVDSSTQP